MIHVLVLLLAFLRGSHQAGLDCLTIERTSINNISFTFGQNTSYYTKWDLRENGELLFGNLPLDGYSSTGTLMGPSLVSKTGCHGHPLYRFLDNGGWDFTKGQEITYRVSMTPEVNQTWSTNSRVTSEFILKATPLLRLPAPCCLSVSQISSGKLDVTWKGESLTWIPSNRRTALSPRYEVRTCKQLSPLPDQGSGSAQGCKSNDYKAITIGYLGTRDFNYVYTNTSEGAFYFDVRIGSQWGRSDPQTVKVTIDHDSSGISDKASVVFVSAVFVLLFVSFY